jgi:hypothetical protein
VAACELAVGGKACGIAPAGGGGAGTTDVCAAKTSAPFVKYAAAGPAVGTDVASAPFVK